MALFHPSESAANTGREAQIEPYVLPRWPCNGVRFNFLSFTSLLSVLSAVPPRPSPAQCFLISWVVGFLCSLTNNRIDVSALVANLRRRRFDRFTGGASAATLNDVDFF